jgi:AcrR family transcriptional regulator
VARISSVDRRLQIVRAALRVIAEQGVQGATTRAIVAEAGMSLASFHYAFDSRDEMMEELIAYVVEHQTVAAFSTIKFGSDIRTTVRDGLQAFLETIIDDPSSEQVLFELMFFAMRTTTLDGLPSRQWSKYYGAATELLNAAAVNAGITWSRPIDEVARFLVAITDGLTVAWLANRNLDAATTVMDIAADSIAALAIPTSTRTKDRSA